MQYLIPMLLILHMMFQFLVLQVVLLLVLLRLHMHHIFAEKCEWIGYPALSKLGDWVLDCPGNTSLFKSQNIFVRVGFGWVSFSFLTLSFFLNLMMFIHTLMQIYIAFVHVFCERKTTKWKKIVRMSKIVFAYLQCVLKVITVAHSKLGELFCWFLRWEIWASLWGIFLFLS